MPVLTSVDDESVIFEWSCNTFVGRRLIGGMTFDQGNDVHHEVSSVHAAFTWNRRANAWQLHDLSSVNGTFVDNQKVSPGAPHLLKPNALIVFARSAWRLSEIEPPPAAASSGAQRRILSSDGLMVLPDEEHPELLVFRSQENVWYARPWSTDEERAGLVAAEGDRVLSHGDVVKVGESEWTISLPSDADTGTGTAQHTYVRHVRLSECNLRIEHPKNLDHFRPVFKQGARRRPLPGRTHHELWWLLAKARHEDAEKGLAPPEQGWRPPEAVLGQLGKRSDTYLNVVVHRSRKQLQKAGFTDYEDIVERRSDPKGLRLGIADVEIVELD